MAEDKKSFLLYTDLIHTVKKLPKEKIGDLFLTILEYVNDMNPTVDDILVDIAFEPIKQQLKRDLRQWEEKIEVRSANGSLGNLKRWNNDLYIQVTESKITLDEAINIANGRKVSHSDNGDTDLSLTSQTVANVAVNVNDNVNVTVNVNDIKHIGDFNSAFEGWIDMRKNIRKAPTARAIELARIKLERLAPDNKELQVQIINQSILNSWQDLFPLKSDNGLFGKISTPINTNGVNPLTNNEW
jgi:hypothetical protein